MMVNFITRRIFLFFQFIGGLCKRAMCCIKRRRRNSCEPTALTTIDIVSDGKVVDSQNWDSWDDSGLQKTSLNPVEEKIRLYREQIASQQNSKEEEESKVDFFLDMTPRITRQKKILLENKTEPVASANFSLAPDPVFNSSELGVWEESQTWEAEADGDLDVSDILREQKRQDRERKILEQQKKKFERSVSNSGRQLVAPKTS